MFYGWVIVACVFVAQFFMVGFFSYGFSTLVDPVQREFGASVTEVQAGISIGGLVGAATAPFLGPLVDKWSARGMIIIGSLLLVVALLLMSVSQSVYQFSAVMATMISGANLLLGPMTASTLVSRWFDASRGKALGIAATGTSIGGFLLPLMLQNWIDSMGWRGGLQMLAGCVAFIVVPLLVFGIKNAPSDSGLYPDGAASAPAEAASAAASHSWTTQKILRNPNYWIIGSSLGFLFLAYVGLLSNLHKYATDLEIESGSATFLISTVAVAGLIGKLIFGWAADQISLRVGLWIAQALAISGIGILSTEPEYAIMLLGTILMGLAAGGMLPVWGALVAAAFGTASYGRVMGLMMPIIAICTAPGPILAAMSVDSTGSYQLALRGFMVAVVVAALILVPLSLATDDGAPESAHG